MAGSAHSWAGPAGARNAGSLSITTSCPMRKGAPPRRTISSSAAGRTTPTRPSSILDRCGRGRSQLVIGGCGNSVRTELPIHGSRLSGRPSRRRERSRCWNGIRSVASSTRTEVGGTSTSLVRPSSTGSRLSTLCAPLPSQCGTSEPESKLLFRLAPRRPFRNRVSLIASFPSISTAQSQTPHFFTETEIEFDLRPEPSGQPARARRCSRVHATARKRDGARDHPDSGKRRAHPSLPCAPERFARGAHSVRWLRMRAPLKPLKLSATDFNGASGIARSAPWDHARPQLSG